MLDTIISTLSYDMGYLYIGQPGTMLRQLGRNFSTNLASEYSKIESAVNSEIERIVTAIEQHY